jgi:hypothetical protein
LPVLSIYRLAWSDVWQLLFMALVAGLLFAAYLRWQQTPRTDPEAPARADVCRLLAVVLVGQILALARSRFALASAGFYACSLLLLLITMAALFYLYRLYIAFRRSR